MKTKHEDGASMMKIPMHALCCILILTAVQRCSSTGMKVIEPADSYKVPVKYNFRFICYDRDITDPGKDRRSYLRIFIDKVESGRTTTGLESQEKIFEEKVAVSRHLIEFEKWVLDKKTESYVKLNNIDQPRPKYKYFTIEENRILIMKVQFNKNGEAEITEEYERD